MTVSKSSPAIAGFLLVWLSIACYPVRAQITPDNTIPNPSSVIIDSNSFLIEGGTTAGTNLFHSFEDFSVPTGTEAFFNNAASVDNILTRITGSNISNIDGLLRANGTANLFLLNPNGIVFGSNARLEIGGSFFGTTANSIVFDNGLEFSATSPEAQPLLAISVPSGLQFGPNPGRIQVEGEGHELTFDTSERFFPPFTRPDVVAGLSVQPENTIALIGGDINLNGGVLVAESGRIELGSVSSGRVRLTPDSLGFVLEYDRISHFQDLHLTQQSSLDASGAGTGGIYLVGDRIALTDGSVALIQSADSTRTGDIAVVALESLELVGTTPGGEVRSSLNQETVSSGNTGDIRVVAGRLQLAEGGQIITRTFDIGSGGNIDIEVAESIEILGSSADSSVFFSSIFSSASGGSSGFAGDINISAERLTILDGGIVSASTFGSGMAGDLNVNVSESVTLAGVDPVFESPSDLTVATSRNGNAGNLTLTTARLVVSDGARVNASSADSGDAGILTIDASESIDVNGGSIRSSVQLPTTIEDIFLDDFDTTMGIAGNVTIRTPVLNVRDRGTITVQNDGLSRAGSLSINADSVRIDSEGAIAAATVSGEGGNITLDSQTLQLRNGSLISAESGGSGNGGNVSINTETIALLDSSTITANAFEGDGGNIQIATTGIFLSPDSGVTASSQLGVEGLVEIINPNMNSAAGLVELERNPIDSHDRVVSGCASARDNRFTVFGRGGLPESPLDPLRGSVVWEDMRPISAMEMPTNTIEIDTDDRRNMLTEATAWQTNDRGETELVAMTPRWIDVGSSTNCR